MLKRSSGPQRSGTKVAACRRGERAVSRRNRARRAVDQQHAPGRQRARSARIASRTGSIERCLIRHFASDPRSRLASPAASSSGDSGTSAAPTPAAAQTSSSALARVAEHRRDLVARADPERAQEVRRARDARAELRVGRAARSNTTAVASGRKRAWRGIRLRVPARCPPPRMNSNGCALTRPRASGKSVASPAPRPRDRRRSAPRRARRTATGGATKPNARPTGVNGSSAATATIASEVAASQRARAARARPAAGADDEDHQHLGRQRLDEPAGVEERLARVRARAAAGRR